MATNAYYVINVYANARCFCIFNCLPRQQRQKCLLAFLGETIKDRVLVHPS